ncbi:hypothetical protein [Metabacillus sp. B2-18]|uniref:hypothetical protein n=1 Tax=Metabacillus sp. B2-18 TaxID=2897333 RepID=UPI001E2E1C52|nr:hypothetical protein [Metabacillus sp. B2-18]UGB29963.1 hypothetical protein LPC09_19925 [Metabacillus sp. B2-18]
MAENREGKLAILRVSDDLSKEQLMGDGDISTNTSQPVKHEKNLITLNELMPHTKSIQEIATGSELLLAYELGRYAKHLLGKELSLTGISISKDLLSEEHFSFVVSNGLDVGFEIERKELADYSKNARYYFTKKVDGVDFKAKTQKQVVYDFEHNTEANRIMQGDNRSAAYVSLIAYIMVKSLRDEVPTPKLLIDHETYTHQNLEYVDLFILKNYGNKILKDLVEIIYSQAAGAQPDWEAFVIFHRQKGLMNKEYTITEKFNHLKENFEVGDVVLYYKRKKSAKDDTIKKLTHCHPAVISGIENGSVKLEWYPIIQTRLTRRVELDEIKQISKERKKESIYMFDDYEDFTICNETFHLTELGIDTCTFSELNFFIKLIDFDGSHQWLKTNEGEKYVWMSTLDTIYAVFEDRGVDYNKEKFLSTYFQPSNREPIYDQYVQASTTKE